MRVLVMASLLGTVGCGRGGYDARVPGLQVAGVMLNAPGAIVAEEDRYDIAPALGGDGYALAWAEFPPGDRTVQLRFAVVSERGHFVVSPQLVELLDGLPSFVVIAKGADDYLLGFGVSGSAEIVALDADGETIAARQVGYSEFALTTTADGFAAVSVSSMRTRVQFLDARGDEVGASVLVDDTGGPQSSARAIWMGDQLKVVWTDTRTMSPRLRTAMVAPDGVVTGAGLLFDEGSPQGNAQLALDDTGGLLVTWDGSDHFPQLVLRFDAAGMPLWPQPLVAFDYPTYHQALEAASSPTAELGLAWADSWTTPLDNIVFARVGGDGGEPTPTPIPLSDPAYEFCYPEIARGATGYGTAFVGEVEGTQGLFLAIVPDDP